MIRKNRPIPGHTAKLLIFDLDGTLIDSREDLANSINAMLIHFGKKELPHEVIASYIGDGAPMLVRRSLGDPDDENFVQDAVLYFMSWYREHKLDNTYVYDGVKEALDAIQKSRAKFSGQPLKMAVLSNKPVALRARSWKRLGLASISFRFMAATASTPKSPIPPACKLCWKKPGSRGRNGHLGDSDIDVLTPAMLGFIRRRDLRPGAAHAARRAARCTDRSSPRIS